MIFKELLDEFLAKLFDIEHISHLLPGPKPYLNYTGPGRKMEGEQHGKSN